MKPAAQAPSVESSDPAHAERLGDFARARALSLAAGAKGPKAGQQAAQRRYLRLGADPMAWRVGLGALCAYTAAWIYALTANR